MHKESPTIETAKKSKEQENHEASQSVESPEDLRRKITAKSEKETVEFKNECANDLAQAESRAEKDGLSIDDEDKKELQELSKKAEVAREELAGEVEGKIEFKEKIPTEEQLDVFKKGKEKVLSLQAEENNKSPEYWVLYSYLTEEIGKDIQWRNVGDISVEKVKKMLIAKFPEKDQIVVRTCPKCGREYESAAASYCECGSELELKQQDIERRDEGKKSKFQEIDSELCKLPLDKEKYREYIEEKKNLPPDAIIHLYHGLKGDDYRGVLGIINSKTHGIEQRSGPTLSFVPFGQFWNKSLGFRYSLRRNQIVFPGEENPNAIVRIGGEGSIKDVGYIENESGSLPLSQFEGEMMYSKGAKIDEDAEEKINEKLHHFAEVRADLNDINNNVAAEQKNKVKELLFRTKQINLFAWGASLEKLTRKGFFPLKVSDQQLMGEAFYGDQADDFSREADNRLQQLSDYIEQYKKEESQDEYTIRKYEETKEIITQLKDEIASGESLIKQSLEKCAQKYNSQK